MTPEQIEEFRQYMEAGMPEETYRKWGEEAAKYVTAATTKQLQSQAQKARQKREAARRALR